MNNIQFDNTMINRILKEDVVMFDDLDNYWVIWTNKGIFAPKNGRMLHETREQALRHWYNSLKWQAIRVIKTDFVNTYHPGKKYWEVKFPCNDKEIWKAFKSEMAEKYDFQIIQWKYVKDKLRE
jgi:hypothetical protein